MENITPINRLADIYNIADFLPNARTLSIKDYRAIFDRDSTETYNSYLLPRIPRKVLPEQFVDKAISIDIILTSHDFLNNTAGVEIPDMHFGMMYPDYPSLFELITRYGKFPKNYLSDHSTDLRIEVDNYYKSTILDRFFRNKGVVFYSELLNISAIPTFTKDAFSEVKINYYDLLVKDGLLRKAEPSELSIILKYQTKDQLTNLIDKNLKEKGQGKKLTTLGKDELIAILANEPEIINIGLHNYFYFLDNTVQDFKNWLVFENTYYNIYDLFHSSYDSSWIFIDSVIKNIIVDNKDYETAFKLAQVYFKQVDNYKRFTNFHAEWVTPRIETQMKKINKFYKNKTLPALPAPTNNLKT